MSKFDTHGGYFAPKDYMRVNEGGSHEENPNGGVQIGVDPEGNPNLLEEGEPVYKDYVYSDNIEAEEQFLVDNNLPKKYTGKLYSKIADDLFSEAEERPLDPISRNGLEALLGRLADAQEGQKQAKEQRDLEDELAQLSPEELEQLEGMLAQSEQGQIIPEQMPMEAAHEEQMMGPAEPMPIEGMPMMANGGFLRMFDGSGKLTDEQKRAIIEQGPILDGSGVRVPSLLEMALGSDNKIVQGVKKAQDWMDNSTAGKVLDFLLPHSAMEAGLGGLGRAGSKAKYLEELSENIYKGERWNKVRDIQKTLRQRDEELKKLAAELKGAKKANNHTLVTDIESKIRTQEFARKGDLIAYKQEFKTANELEPIAGSSKSVKSSTTPKQESQPAQPEQTSSAPGTKTFNGKKYVKGAIGTGIGATGILHGYNYIYKPIVKDIHDHRNQQPYIFEVPDSTSVDAAIAPSDTIKIGSSIDLGFLDEEPEYKALGGKINRFDEGGDAYRRFMKLLTDYDVSKNRGGIEGMYQIDRNFDPYLRGNKNLGALEHDPRYVAFTDLVKKKAAEGNRRALMYLSRLDNGVADWTDRLFDQNGNLRNGWEAIYDDRRYDGDAGIYHLIPEFNDVKELDGFFDDPQMIQSTFAGYTPNGSEDSIIGPRLSDIVSANLSTSSASSGPGNGNGAGQDTSASEYGYSPNILPTWPRYAGAIGSGLLGLYNAFQSPDRYTAPHINPVLPEGRINLQNQVYNPIDQNMIANAQIAQGNATNRALRNSGLGPSAGAAILAADNNLTGNLGTGFIQAWDANNQRRNAVIAANNQAEAQRAQFDYTVDAARKDAINRLAPYNAQNDLMVQRLNNQAEGDKYTAISNQISNGLQALSGIGQENFAMNQINTNPAFLGYRVGSNGAMFFNPNTGKWEKVKS